MSKIVLVKLVVNERGSKTEKANDERQPGVDDKKNYVCACAYDWKRGTNERV